MIRDRDILLISVVLGIVAGGLLYLAVWVPLPVEGRQALMLAVGMTLMATLSTLSTYMYSRNVFRAVVLAPDSPLSSPKRQLLDRRDTQALDESRIEIFNLRSQLQEQMSRVAGTAGPARPDGPVSFIALAEHLCTSNIIKYNMFWDLIFFEKTCSMLEKEFPMDQNDINLAVRSGREWLRDLRLLSGSGRAA